MTTFELTPEEMELFLTESAEQVDTMEELLVVLEKGTDPDAVSAIFRAAHTLKGAAATAGMDATARLTHALESLLDQIRNGRREADGETVDALLETVDVLRTCLRTIEETGSDAGLDVDPLVQRLEALAAAAEAVDAAPAALGGGEAVDTPAAPEVSDPALAAFVQEATARGEHVFRCTIEVEAGTPMPSIRLYQALMVFDEMGRLADSKPSRAEIEDPMAEHSRLEAVLATARGADEVRQALSEVSHLSRIDIEPIDDVKAPPAPSDAPAASEAVQAAAAAAKVVSPKTPAAGGTATHVADTVRVSVRVLDKLMNLVGELVIDRTRLARLGHVDMDKQELVEELNLVAGHLTRITTDLQDTIMNARMVPLETLFRRFPRMVRDLARRLDKQVKFVISGEDTELDRAVIEQIGDPLVHLIRNAIDHGLESPQERRAAGKPAEGTVRLAAYHQDNHICVQVSDDGRGIDAEKVKRAAVAKGLITEDEAKQLQGNEALDLLFLPGFSTSGQVTDVSGRGVGLDVVRRNIERVNGSVAVDSVVGQGTVWTIRLPLTLAIVQAMLVRVNKTIFAVPLDAVDEIVLVHGRSIHMAGGWPMVTIREHVIPLVNPGLVWADEFAASWNADDENPVLILQSPTGPLALAVDELIGEQETVIKTIEGLGGQVPGVSGASILGDGSVALIFDVTGFAKEVRRIDHRVRRYESRHGKSA